jgi:hypothetical protein
MTHAEAIISVRYPWLDPSVEAKMLGIETLEVEGDGGVRRVAGALCVLHLGRQARVDGRRLRVGQLVGDRDASRRSTAEELMPVPLASLWIGVDLVYRV